MFITYAPSDLSRLFGVVWEESQLKGILDVLDLPKECEYCVAGGSVVRHLMGVDIFKGDIDIFPQDKNSYDGLVRAITSSDTFWETLYSSEYSDSFTFKKGVRATKIQLIKTDLKETLQTRLNRFDFDHCRVGMKVSSGRVYASPTALLSLALKKLRLYYVKDPHYSLGRALKYKRMGFDADEAIEQLATLIKDGKKNVRISVDRTGESSGPSDVPSISFSFEELTEATEKAVSTSVS